MSREPFSTPVRRIQLPFHLVVGVLSALLVLLVVAALAVSANRGGKIALGSVADEAIAQNARLLDERLGRIFEPAENQLRLLAHSRFGPADTLAQRLDLVPVALEVVDGNPLVQALFVGYRNGDFILFRPLGRASVAALFDSPPGSVLLVQSVTHGTSDEAATGEYRFFDTAGRLLELREMPDYHFDPRTRPWYRASIDVAGTVLTDPYLFFTTREVGVTLARRTVDGQAVIGLDAEMETLTAQLEPLLITPSSELAIVDAQGLVIAYRDADRILVDEGKGTFRLSALAELGVAPLVRAFELSGPEGTRARVEVDGRNWQLVRLPLRTIGEMELAALLAIPDDELFAAARAVVSDLLMVALVILLLSIPVGFWLTHRAVAPLQRLAEGMRAIESFDFTERPISHSHIGEIDRLASATERMRATIANFMQTSVALGAMRETDELLETILNNAVGSSVARGGAIHLVGEDNRLERVRTQGEEADGVLERCFPHACMSADGSIVGDAVQARQTCTRVLDEGLQVATPLLTRTGELVGVLSVLLPQDSVPDARGRDPRLGFMEALSASAAVAIETRNFIAQQRRLLESFIELIAAAIDAKSPYTGGHCQRVPELTKMLAAAAERAQEGPFADFSLSEDEREALHIGAWLHDCGKITTPEHIVDKRTKLECIYDRIHEVRMRFEVLKRDARIRALEARLGGADPASTQTALDAQWCALDDAFAFIASCNLGGETMNDAQLQRLNEIAQWTWTRTLDDRLGVSWEELQRRASEPPAHLPVEEPVLIDASWHKVPRPQSERFAPDNPWGFKMDVPQLKHNQGERYNLSVARGTLTREDRYIINHHMIQTLIMLSKLPFPRHLANVPEIAGGHHERMDGTGYPRRLRREDMSILARTMAIADVFEALTANDRPYKRPNTLREAIIIMARMVRDQHLDPDLFRLFVVSGVYREYGLRFLAPEQINEVDVSCALEEAGLSA